MDDRWSRLRSLVEAALELPVEDRDPFLDEQCADDEALRDEAAGWLAAATDGEPFLEPPPRPAGGPASSVDGTTLCMQTSGPTRSCREVASRPR